MMPHCAIEHREISRIQYRQRSAMKLKLLISDNVKLFIFSLLLLNFAFLNLDIMNAISHSLIVTLNINAVRLANISAYGFYANLIALMLFSSTLDQFNLVRITKFMLLITAMSCLILAFNTNILTFIIYRCIVGMLVGIAFPACMRIVALKARHKAGTITALYTFAAMTGGFLAQNPIVGLLQYTSINTLFSLLGVVGFAIMLIPRNDLIKQEKFLPSTKLLLPLLTAIKNSDNWLTALHVSLLNLPIFLLADLWSNLYLIQKLHISESVAAFTTSMIFIGYIIGALIFGRLADQFATKRIMMQIGIVIALLSLILILLSDYWIVFPVLFLLLGMGSGAQVIGFSQVAVTNSHWSAASATAMLSFVSVLMGAIFQQISGNIVQQQSGSMAAFNEIIYLLMLCLGVSFLAASLLSRKSLDATNQPLLFQE